MARLFQSIAVALLLLFDAGAKASDLLSPTPLASQDERFEGWSVGGLWENPFDTFRADNPDPADSASLTGSLFGAFANRGFQRGILYGGFSGSLAGGVIEGQSDGPNCPGNCYTSLNALGELTLSIGLVFRDKVLFYVGGGPNFAIMRSGQTLYGLHDQFVSGEHGTAGIKFAVDNRWSFLAQAERVRLGDLYYNTPSGWFGVNVRDFWMASMGFEYRFASPNAQPMMRTSESGH